jgi:uncharacterized phage protein (TIGR01671 family)
MREILFRAKAINRYPNREYRTNYKNGDWVYGLITNLCDGVFATMKNTDGVDGVDVDPETVGQYTGFMDSGQNKIFEGDIIEISRFYNDVSQATDNYLCRYDSKSAAFVYNYIIPEDMSSFNRKYVILSRHADLGDFIGHTLKVIGNIYDTPEISLKGMDMYNGTET